MPQKTDSIVLGGGCFWCLDALYRQVRGVSSVVSGFAGGAQPNPTYDQVVTGATGHAEVVQVSFDPETVSLEDILQIFWASHNPTTLNRQGADVGTQYRSIVLYADQSQKRMIDKVLNGFAKNHWDQPIVTKIKPLGSFYPAEEEHQDYFSKDPSRAYCQIVINPKVAKFRKEFAAKLK